MIHPSKGDHANHPGHGNGNCPLRTQVNAHIYGTSSNGYGCSWTGGHCVKSDACETRVQQHEAEAPDRERQRVLDNLYSKKAFRRKGKVQ
jgi:hypothetical protein